jgi:predicted PurR-regulated permease PerM
MLRSLGLRWTIQGAGFGLGLALVAGAIGLAIVAAPVLVLLFVGILLASGLEPLIGFVRARTGLGRGLTILVVFATFLVLVVGFTLIVLPAAIGQANEAVGRLPSVLDSMRSKVSELRPAPLAQSLTALVDAARSAIHPPPPDQAVVVSVGLTVAQAAGALTTLLAIVYFWLVEHARLQRYALAFLPAHRRAAARDAWNEVESRLGLWVRGQLTLMLALAVATGVVYSLLGVPAAVLLAVIAGLCEAIPIVGPLVAAIPALIIAASVSTQLMFEVALCYVIVQLIEGNVLVPLVMRNAIGLSPLMVLVSLLVGATAAGVPGAFVAVPVAAAVEAILERFQARKVAVSPEPPSEPSVKDEDAVSTRQTPDSAAEERLARRLPDAAHR